MNSLRIFSRRNLAFVELDGKRIYLGPPGPEAEIAYHEIMLERLKSKRDPMTIAVLTCQYLEYAEGYYGASSQMGIVERAVKVLCERHVS